ncbi:MAG: hypothetical protein HC842_00305 [Cytophagales bacterium]|nr:hypothetical protein [Cytophagales bacterium]
MAFYQEVDRDLRNFSVAFRWSKLKLGTHMMYDFDRKMKKLSFAGEVFLASLLEK